MQVLDDIWSTIKGNAKTRIKDPIVGTFIVSWCFCNWDKLALLFWGKGDLEKRISALVESMALLSNPSLLKQDLGLLLIPTALTIGYLFILPLASLWVKEKQKKTAVLQYSHAVDLDIEHTRKQWELNKERLRSNPEKDFLAQDVALDIQKEKNRIERRDKIREFIDKKVKTASALADKTKADAEAEQISLEKKRLELEEKQRKATKEKQRYEEQSAIHNATMASHRFPAVFYFMNLLSDSLKQDRVVLTASGLVSCIAAVFGYETTDELINDKDFSNEYLTKLKYIILDDGLAKNLDAICERENSDNEDLSSDLLFNHIQMLFEELPFKLVSEDTLVEEISERVNEDSNDLLMGEDLSGPMAETDTIFDEIELSVDSHDLNTSFDVKMSGYASGSHRKEADVPGRDLTVNVDVTCEPVMGSFGLQDYELTVSGEPRDYD
ncbi:hypothetical protein MUS1_09540 [Marinomonas ushuaiensis DSM 15871]|uniref:Uncharacterized protein n=1 Tax=Marinomonas ushuaiensis DSM 15871 TaxID=1122207 RepID=X7E6F9_9GAMM|nr:hypothetical protein [Marinomonas ushuaiensis]ETX11659.1 hypothetical protein MUS1_09540 [Marinomonas ushuaiensis DSM 15871]